MRGLAVRAFLQTRGTARASDYAFLGAGPEEPWWRAYRDATAFDHPTALVTSDGAVWAAYLSGIPSARTDAVGTVVRYTLVLDGPSAAPETDCVLAGLAAWLDDVASAADRPGARLSSALDARFPAELVDRMLTAPFPGGSPVPVLRYCTDATVVQSFVLDALRTLPVPPPAPDEPGDWIAAVGTADARAALVARARALLGGAPGRALLLNLVGHPDDLVPLRDPASPLAVLVDAGAEGAGRALARPVALPPVVEAKKAPAPAGGATRVGVPPTWWTAATIGATAVLAVIIAVTAAVLLLL